jgi:uroporphyrinogen-III synthase
MAALQGVGVLVTRPEQQAKPLCNLLESAGAVVFRLPAIDIEPAADLQSMSSRLGPLANFDLIVFTSANAVRCGAGLLSGSGHPRLAAIGPATARALDASGHRVTVTPAAGYDSESLLREPQLARLEGKRVLLVKGRHGRELLQERLTERGARVSVAEVYRRVPAHPDAATLAALEATMAAGRVQVMTATSAEIAASLIALATPALRRTFDRVHWLVPGARVAAAVREHGVTAPILQADSALDQDLVCAVVRWRESVSGA